MDIELVDPVLEDKLEDLNQVDMMVADLDIVLVLNCLDIAPS